MPKTVLTYIVESTITCDLPGEEPLLFDPRRSESTFQVLKHEFGFVLVVWSPATPDLVREFHWNTEEERLRDRNNVGRIVERKATEREKREGQRQHEEDQVRGRDSDHGRAAIGSEAPVARDASPGPDSPGATRLPAQRFTVELTLAVEASSRFDAARCADHAAHLAAEAIAWRPGVPPMEAEVVNVTVADIRPDGNPSPDDAEPGGAA